MIRAIPFGKLQKKWAVETRKWPIIQVEEKRHGVITMGSMNVAWDQAPQ